MIHENQFENYRQHMNWIDLKDMRLQKDRVLIEDLPHGERIGSIWLPEICQDTEQLRWGIVRVVGPGDTGIERTLDDYSTYTDGRPRTQITPAVHGHLPMSVKVGQKVLYTRRQEAEIFVNGDRFVMVYEEQSILAVWLRGKLRPLRERVIIGRDEVHQKTSSGLYIPPGAQEERSEGKVMAVGRGRLLADGKWIPVELRRGDQVVFEKGRGSDFTMRGKRFLVMSEKSVLGVING